MSRLILSVVILCSSGTLVAQLPGPASGDVTLRLIQGVDSAVPMHAISQGTVTESTNPDIHVGSTGAAQLVTEPDGGSSVQLVRLLMNGQAFRVASSSAVFAPDHAPSFLEKGRWAKYSTSGSHVFLPQNTLVRFTLAALPGQGTAPASPNNPSAVRSSIAAPRHPASTVVDLPPALPGAPPLHASRPANDGCWWEPFASKSLGFELPVQHCSKAADDPVVQESPTGLESSFHKGEPLQDGFTVLSKPADQTIEASIKARFFKKPSDRIACVVKKYPNEGNFQSYGVAPLRSRRTDCAGLYEADSDATEAIEFLYNPADSKTRYIEFKGENISDYPFDLQALRFVDGTSDTPSRVEGSTASVPSSTGVELQGGPTAPVNRLNVRGMSVRMGRAQLIRAAMAANMKVVANTPKDLTIVDSTVDAAGQLNGVGGNISIRGSGLVLRIGLENDTATIIIISEQGATHGEVFQDLSKKWGKPEHLPRDYSNELGTSDKATWGNKSDVYAEYDPSQYSFLGQTVRILDGEGSWHLTHR